MVYTVQSMALPRFFHAFLAPGFISYCSREILGILCLLFCFRFAWKVWPIEIDLKFIEPVGRELNTIGKEMVHFWLLWGAVGMLPMQSTLIGLGTLRKDLEKLRPPSVTELLWSNDGDQILEGCLTNFFIICRKDENEVTYEHKDAVIKRSVEVQTAPIGDGVLPGVVRQVIIEEAAIPSMTLIMGANLLKGIKRSGVNLWLILGILVVQFIVLPVLGVVVIKAARSFGMVGSDPLYHFVLLLQYSVPPAMAIVCL